MPRLISHELSDELYERLNGRAIDKYLNHAVLLYTVDANGWPHPSLLSYFEIAAIDRKNLRVATYNSSNTTENMRRNGIVTLSIFDLRVAYAIKGRPQEIRREMRSAPRNCMLNVAVEHVRLMRLIPFWNRAPMSPAESLTRVLILVPSARGGTIFSRS